jgi:hypothetical protein
MEGDAKFLKHELIRCAPLGLSSLLLARWGMELQAIQEHNIVLVMSFPTSREAEMIILSFLYRRVGEMRIEYD